MRWRNQGTYPPVTLLYHFFVTPFFVTRLGAGALPGASSAPSGHGRRGRDRHRARQQQQRVRVNEGSGTKHQRGLALFDFVRLCTAALGVFADLQRPLNTSL